VGDPNLDEPGLDEPGLDDLLDLALRAGRRAGAFLAGGQHRDRRRVDTKASATDMVSEMDTGAEALIVEILTAERPDDEILAEEGGSSRGTSGLRWVVDPLDGTTNYLYGHPCYAVSIAAERHGAPVVGVVVDPGRGEAFWARRGGGAFRDGEPVRVSGLEDASTALVATGFSYDRCRRAEQAALLAPLLPRVRDLRRHGVASLDLCWVACGRLDAYFETDLKPWDVAAGTVIAREAGAAVRGLDGGPPAPGSIVAATPGVVEELLGLLGPSTPPR